MTASLWAICGAAPVEARSQFGAGDQAGPLQAWPNPGLERGGDGVAPAERLAGLAPEQRQQMRQQMREHWQQMPPDQRDLRRQDNRERWQPMPADERQRMREEMRGQRGGNGGRFGGRDERR